MKLEITIEMSPWLMKSALINAIKTKLEWLLATGGCKLVEIKEIET